MKVALPPVSRVATPNCSAVQSHRRPPPKSQRERELSTRGVRRVIALGFRALNGESVMLIRGAYFRIFADGTLRGPDNAVAASYTNGLSLRAPVIQPQSSEAGITHGFSDTFAP